MDNSFIKLHTSLDKALSVGKVKTAELIYFNSIVLSPNETYLQITNVDGGISFEGDFMVEIVDFCDNVLKDVTAHVFVSEATTSQGINQMAIEIVNLGTDFYGRAVMFKFTHTISNAVYYSNPLLITDSIIDQTIRFDYWNATTINNIYYNELPFKQSIRLKMLFQNPTNESENTEYYQISNGRTVSTRYLEKIKYNYIVEDMNLFSYVRLLRLFKSNSVYMDGERVTDKPILDEGDRLGNSTLINTSFSAYIDENDTFDYEFQIYDGLKVIEFIPFGTIAYNLSDLNPSVIFNYDILLGDNLDISLFKLVDNTLINTWNASTINIVGNIINLDEITSLPVGSYFFTINSTSITDLFGEP